MHLLSISPILAFQSAWTAGSAVICIGILAIVALVRSHTHKEEEGAH